MEQEQPCKVTKRTDRISKSKSSRSSRPRTVACAARNRAVLEAVIESLPHEFFAIDEEGRYFFLKTILLQPTYANIWI